MLHYNIVPTPIGDLLIAANDKGLCSTQFINAEERQKIIGGEFVLGACKHIELATRELESYFRGELKQFSVPLVFHGTDFQKRVWDSLLRIGYGTTIDYKTQASDVAIPNGARAVANANAKNHIAIIVPCHRVIRSNGDLSGYSYGADKKKWLLDHERVHRL